MDKESNGEMAIEDSEAKYKQQRRDEQIDRVLSVAETGAQAAHRASISFSAWLFEPERPPLLKPYVMAWVKLMAIIVVGTVGVGEYAHIRDPVFFGAPTVFTNPEYLEMAWDIIWSAGKWLAILCVVAWLCHHGMWEWTRDRREWLEKEREREEEYSHGSVSD